MKITKKQKPFNWHFLMPLMLAASLNPLNSSMIATALPKISESLKISAGTATLLVSILYLVSAVAQPTFGKLAEIFGPRKILIIGSGFAACGGLIGGTIHTFISLLIARIFIGLGTSSGYPSAMLIISQRANHLENKTIPGNVLGNLQIASMATSALGLPLGGVLVGLFDWPSIFYINILIAVIILTTTLAWLPADMKTADFNNSQLLKQLDLPGIGLFAATVITLLVWLFNLPTFNLPIFVIMMFCIVSLIIWERHAKVPFFDVKFLWHHQDVVLTLIRILLLSICVYTIMYGVSQWLEATHASSAEVTGLLLLPMSVVSAIIIPPIASRNLVRLPLMVATLASLVGSVGLLFFDAQTPLLFIIIVTTGFGIVLGAMSQGSQLALYLQVPVKIMGTASGLLRTFGYIGSIMSSSLINIGFRSEATTSGLHLIAFLMIIVSLIVAVITIFDQSLKQARKRSKA